MEAIATSTDRTCAAFEAEEVAADAGSLRRFLVGQDAGPRPMEDDELARELNDPFATLLLAQGRFPGTPQGVLDAIDEVVDEGHPLAKDTQLSFLVGEGTQIAKDPTRRFDRRLRFLVTRGRGPEGPDLIMSVFAPTEGLIELMAWDAVEGGFNFYRTISGGEGDRGAWVWAGNSRHAFDPDTRARGPFESHPTGNVLMKELKVPWINWASPKAVVDERDFAAGDARATHSWFGEHAGAYVLEDSVIRKSIHRWNRHRLERIARAGELRDPLPLFEQLLGSRDSRRHTVNLVSSPDSSRSIDADERLRLPPTFFVDVDGLCDGLGLKRPPELTAPGALYREALESFQVFVRNEDDTTPRWPGEELFERRGDTHFAFVVPERAFEDVDLLEQLLDPQGPVALITPRLAACLLMVDFPNPVFSDARAGLADHVPAGPVASERWPDFSRELGDAIAGAARDAPQDAPEREFAALWEQGEDGWHKGANELLGAYYGAISTRLETPEGFESYFKLAEARRNRVRAMPIKESALLFAQTNLPAEELSDLAMSRSATVTKRGGPP